MKRAAIALLAGCLFGIGLTWSGMVDPQRVRGFLDILGKWDSTLAFVMAGAIVPMALAWVIQKRLRKPFADAHFSLPDTTKLDGRLAIGAILFGIGWGIGGLCPGPALSGLSLAPKGAGIFIAAMLAGMLLERALPRGN